MLRNIPTDGNIQSNIYIEILFTIQRKTFCSKNIIFHGWTIIPVLENWVICNISFSSFLCDTNTFEFDKLRLTVKYTLKCFKRKKKNCDELFYVQSHLADDDVSSPCFLFVVRCCCSPVILLTIWLSIRKWSNFSMCLCDCICIMDGKMLCYIRNVQRYHTEHIKWNNVCSLPSLPDIPSHSSGCTHRLWHKFMFYAENERRKKSEQFLHHSSRCPGWILKL